MYTSCIPRARLSISRTLLPANSARRLAIWPRWARRNASHSHAQLARATQLAGRDQRRLEDLGASLAPATPPRPGNRLAAPTPLQRQKGVHSAHLRPLCARQALAHRRAAITGARYPRQWSAQLGLRRGPSPPLRREAPVLTQRVQLACRRGGRLRVSAPAEVRVGLRCGGRVRNRSALTHIPMRACPRSGPRDAERWRPPHSAHAGCVARCAWPASPSHSSHVLAFPRLA